MKSEIHRYDGATCLAFAFDRSLDHAQVREMARVVESAMEHADDLRLLLDLSATENFEAGAFFSPEGLLASLRSVGPVSRYAVVSAPAVAAAAIEAFGAILPLKSRTFASQDIEKAREWIGAPPA